MNVTHTVEILHSSASAITIKKPSPLLSALKLGRCLVLEIACRVDGVPLGGEELSKHSYNIEVAQLLEKNIYGAKHLLIGEVLDGEQVVEYHLAIDPEINRCPGLVWKKLKIEMNAPSGLVRETTNLLSKYLTIVHPYLFGEHATILHDNTAYYTRILTGLVAVGEETHDLYQATLERIRSKLELQYGPELNQILNNAGWSWTNEDLIKKYVEDLYVSHSL